MSLDVAIVGGGPAGLAAAIEAAARGFSVTVFERRTFPIDKACGEGLMPSGVRQLRRLGVWPHLDLAESSPFTGITYVQEDGRSVTGALPEGGGVAVRRVALSAALVSRAREVGVEVREHSGVRAHRVDSNGVTLVTDAGDVRAKLLVAADGVNSPLRESLGVSVPSPGPRRFGVRRHFEVAPWSPNVEVHYCDVAEAYVTPNGANRVGVAMLWDAARVPTGASFESLLERFPLVKARVQGARFLSERAGAGPLRHDVQSRVADRVLLLGDAAGYVDAITGEGLTLALEAVEVFGEVLPRALRDGASAATLSEYDRRVAASFRRYALLAGGLVWIAGRPPLRRFIIDRLINHPPLFERALALALG